MYDVEGLGNEERPNYYVMPIMKKSACLVQFAIQKYSVGIPIIT